eukprot:CAMPEP_0176229846 /NCGR_PEP_ID=MMETSP0121_2-20121125/23995_1 /TAXON_ID=160619 /ORGANISM="Kryptoperidinium foliaceum, Strain CCMP 1326" /LENGTH=85 /DNA_ID=CAMNT_0017569173 /DNA_START=50 /DNA_END=303 /DNA_ORIENTATION=-
MPRVSLAIFAAAALACADARALTLRQPGTATAMAGLEGEACDADEHKRYRTIVCQVEETCGCSGTVCELEWCSKYVHEWKKEFGA